MQTTEACGDVPRGFLGSPVAGIAADELIDPTSAIEEITRRYIGDPSLSNLPRKYKTAITGHPSQDVVHEINDCSFVAVDHPEHGIGYDLWVGGALSVVPRFAERLGAWVHPDQVVDVWLGVTEIFRDYGYRRLRNKARMKFLLADWGPEKLRDVLETEYLGYKPRRRSCPGRSPRLPATMWASTSRRTESTTSESPSSPVGRRALCSTRSPIWPRSTDSTRTPH